MGKKIKGITIEIDGSTTKLQKALKEVDTNAKGTQEALKSVNRLAKINPNSTVVMTQKQGLLAKQIGETSKKLELLKQAQTEALNTEGIDKNSEEYQELERDIAFAEEKLKSLQAQQDKLVAKSSKLGQISTKFEGISKKAEMVAEKMRGISTAATIALAGATKVAADFDAQMSKVKAISGATGEQFEKLRNKAQQMGTTTKFTATEAGEAMEYMGMAGWKSDQMLKGLPAILDLAAASEEDLGLTSDIVTDALTAFGLKAEDAAGFADVLATASSNSNTNVAMMGETFKYAAPVAGSLGFTVEDTALAIGLMANSGIKASQAGTTLRGALSRLVKPTGQAKKEMENLGLTITNQDGSMKSFREIMLDLRDSMEGLTEKQKAQTIATLFGQEAMSGIMAIVNSSDEDFDKLAGAIDNSAGSAKKMADEMQDNLSGDLTKLKSAAEGAGIAIGESLRPMMRDTAQTVTELVSAFQKLSPETQETIAKTVLLTASLYPASKVISGTTGAISTFTGGLAKLKVSAGNSNTVIGKLWGTITAHPAAMAAVGVAGLATAFYKLYKEVNKETIAYNKNVEARRKNVVAAESEINNTNYLYGKLVKLNKVEHKTAEQKKEMQGIVDLLNQKVSGLNLKYDAENDKLNQSTKAIRNKIKAMEDQVRAEVYAENYKEALKDQVKWEEKSAKQQEKINALKEKQSHYKPDSSEYRKLASEIALAKGKLGEYNEKAKRAKKETDKIGQTTAFENLVAEAAKAGHKVPQSIKDGVRKGKYVYPQSVGEMLALGNKKFAKNNAILKKNGGKMPKEIAKGLESGKMSAGTAADKLGKYVNNKYGDGIKKSKGKPKKEMEKTRKETEDKGKPKNSKKNGEKVSTDYGAGIRNKKSHPKNEMDKTRNETENNGKPRSSRTNGQKVSTDYGSGIAARKAFTEAKARAVAQGAERNIKVKNTNSIGKFASRGLADGILSGRSGVISAAGNIARAAWQKMKNALDIHSPSRVTRELGSYTTEGFALGMSDKAAMVKKSSEDMAALAVPTQAINNSIKNYAGNTIDYKLLSSVLVSAMRNARIDVTTGSQQIVLDTGILVGALAGEMDRRLGDLQLQKGRGLI